MPSSREPTWSPGAFGSQHVGPMNGFSLASKDDLDKSIQQQEIGRAGGV